MTRRRRARGEGSVRRLPSGAWQIRLTVGRDGSGGQKRRAVCARTLADAQAKARKILEQVERGTYQDDKRTVAGFVEGWLEDVVRTSQRVATFDSYRRLLRRHVLGRIGGLRLRDLRPHNIEYVLAEMEHTAREDYMAALMIAPVQAALGMVDEASASIRRSYEERDAALMFLHILPLVGPILELPAYLEVRIRLGLDV